MRAKEGGVSTHHRCIWHPDSTAALGFLQEPGPSRKTCRVFHPRDPREHFLCVKCGQLCIPPDLPQQFLVRFRLAPLSPVRSEPPPAAAAPSEKPAAPQDLGAPAQQSSLALSLELQAARAAAGSQFDAAKAVEEQLRKSFQTRCGLEESVAEGLNVPRSRRLFRDLVSLQVPEEQVLSAALREKLALLPPQARAPPPKVRDLGLFLCRAPFPFPRVTLALGSNSPQEPPGSGPDMTILCDPDTLFYESPHLTLDGLPPLRLQLRPRPSEDTFLMHRTLRRWEV
uniref:protein phosphatase 1 regulatory subunit 35 isoform X3 n=1 Tax=Halichoerus grypus TaxID=9711 RepID=UPI00165994E4|nr:protein phosphatase 1 regulatory subunit 35 isoform X3 [Halichoerus grypus]